MNYLALDQSLNTTGWACFTECPGLKLIDYGVFTIKSTKSIDTRLGEFYQQLNNIVKDHNIDYIFFEDIQYQNNKETFKKLAYVQSAIYLWCFWNQIKYSVLAPSHWRKIITDNFGVKFGKARADQKKNCWEFVLSKFHLSRENLTEDMADAIALGVAGSIEVAETTSNW